MASSASTLDRPGPLWRVWRVASGTAAIAIFLWGSCLRFRLPQWPVIVPDSYIYLIPVVNGGVYGIGPRMFLYPMFCRVAEHLAHDWRGIAAVQHLLGLLGPTLMLLAWWALGKRIWRSRLARAIHEFAGLVMVLLLVPSGVYIAYEHQVLLESPNGFLQCCLLALLCWLWLPMPPGRRVALACVTASLGIFMYYANPRWGAAAPLVVVLAVSAVPAGRRLRAGWPALGAAALTFFSMGFLQSHLVTKDPWADTFTAKHLLWMHADLAVNEFRRDLAGPVPPPHAALLRKIIPKIDKEIVGFDASYWHTLTFNANALLYVADNPDADVANAFRDDPEGYRQFCLHYYWRIVWHQPAAYFRTVRRMLGWYYATPPLRDGAFREVTAPITAQLQGSVPIALELVPSAVPPEDSPLEKAILAMKENRSPPALYIPAPWLFAWVEYARVWFLPATLAGAVGGLTALWWNPRPGLAVLARLSLASISVLFAQVLTLSMVTITEGRYSDALRTLAVFSLVCSLLMVGALICQFGTALVGAIKPRTNPAAGAAQRKPDLGLDEAGAESQT